MSKLKIGAIEDDKPVTMTIKLPAAIHRDLRIYAEVLKQEGGHTIDLNSLVAPMLARFMAADRAFDERDGKFKITMDSFRGGPFPKQPRPSPRRKSAPERPRRVGHA